MNATSLNEASIAQFAHLFQALGDSTRLALLQHLASGEHRVRDLVDHLGVAQSTVSQHLRFLAECGLISLRTEGRSSWYALDGTVPLDRLVAAAELVLEATRANATMCEHIRQPYRSTH